ncbi:hypothetical protein [Gemmata obscuriglobus]|uniref:hypothetical protein n=1 Tax=Gemmata obscuriglobus TaxID=114 RepID=UPI0013A70AA7|nr:hypothetical protein [Gemmata obscuriglobus]
MTANDAGAIIADMKDRWSRKLGSPKQERTLKRAGVADGPVPKDHAKALLDWLAPATGDRPGGRRGSSWGSCGRVGRRVSAHDRRAAGRAGDAERGRGAGAYRGLAAEPVVA